MPHAPFCIISRWIPGLLILFSYKHDSLVGCLDDFKLDQIRKDEIESCSVGVGLWLAVPPRGVLVPYTDPPRMKCK